MRWLRKPQLFDLIRKSHMPHAKRCFAIRPNQEMTEYSRPLAGAIVCEKKSGPGRERMHHLTSSASTVRSVAMAPYYSSANDFTVNVFRLVGIDVTGPASTVGNLNSHDRNVLSKGGR